MMEQYLSNYISTVRPAYQGIAQKTAHDIASTYLSYKFGLFGKAAEEASRASAALPDGSNMALLKKALAMVGERSTRLDNSDYSPETSVIFTPDEMGRLAMNLRPDQVEDMAILQFDNAVLLVYAAAYVSSPDDQDSLDEQVAFAINILESYHTALMIQS
ncbi:MAG: hypothetical protein ABFC24_11020 [Methanoregulaceae archaeon]